MLTDIIQGSPEWHALRCGKVTASRIGDLMATTKSGPSASRKNYMAQLVAERLSGQPQESYTNAAMQHGADTEPQARAAYEFFKCVDVEQTGFVNHPRINMAGASPDGLVGEAGLLEIKCPNSATHLDNLLGASIDRKYLLQMQFQMACTEREWCDFVSYDPRLPQQYQICCQRVERDDKLIAEIEKAVRAFLAELEDKINALRTMYDLKSTLMAG